MNRSQFHILGLFYVSYLELAVKNIGNVIQLQLEAVRFFIQNTLRIQSLGVSFSSYLPNAIASRVSYPNALQLSLPGDHLTRLSHTRKPNRLFHVNHAWNNHLIHFFFQLRQFLWRMGANG